MFFFNGLSPDRAILLPANVSILMALFSFFHIDRLAYAWSDLSMGACIQSHGICLDSLSFRTGGVRELLKKYHCLESAEKQLALLQRIWDCCFPDVALPMLFIYTQYLYCLVQKLSHQPSLDFVELLIYTWDISGMTAEEQKQLPALILAQLQSRLDFEKNPIESQQKLTGFYLLRVLKCVDNVIQYTQGSVHRVEYVTGGLHVSVVGKKQLSGWLHTILKAEQQYWHSCQKHFEILYHIVP